MFGYGGIWSCFPCFFMKMAAKIPAENSVIPAESSVNPAENAGAPFLCQKQAELCHLFRSMCAAKLTSWVVKADFKLQPAGIMQSLASRTLSTETLDRGVALLRQQTMSLESDPAYLELLAEREKLLVPCLRLVAASCHV